MKWSILLNQIIEELSRMESYKLTLLLMLDVNTLLGKSKWESNIVLKRLNNGKLLIPH